MKFVNKLKEYRLKRKMTQAELAEKSGVSRTTIVYLECGSAKVAKTDTLIKLATALNASVKEIFFIKKV